MLLNSNSKIMEIDCNKGWTVAFGQETVGDGEAVEGEDDSQRYASQGG